MASPPVGSPQAGIAQPRNTTRSGIPSGWDGCGCLLGLFSLAVMAVAVREIISWLDSAVCSFAGTYC